MKTHSRALAALSLATFIVPAWGQCMRLEEVPVDPNRPPPFDGPGSFGPLHGILSLDCLSFKRVEVRDGKRIAVLQDNHGKLFYVQEQDNVGENAGRVTEITPAWVTVTQVVKGP